MEAVWSKIKLDLFMTKQYIYTVSKEIKQRLKEQIIWRKKNIKREYGRNRYHNMSKEIKQRLKEYQKRYKKL